MSYFAKVENSIVTDVIRITQDELNLGFWGDPTLWIETSYNTKGGIYYIPDTETPDPDQSKALRANYAGVGFTYDVVNDVFYAPQPAPDWTIGPPTWIWVNPNPTPPPITGTSSVFMSPMTITDSIGA
jgi:hypothetical protein